MSRSRYQVQSSFFHTIRAKLEPFRVTDTGTNVEGISEEDLPQGVRNPLLGAAQIYRVHGIDSQPLTRVPNGVFE